MSMEEESATAVALKEYFSSKGVSPEDIEITIKVLNSVSELSHKNSSHKRKHIGSVTSAKKKRKSTVTRDLSSKSMSMVFDAWDMSYDAEKREKMGQGTLKIELTGQ